MGDITARITARKADAETELQKVQERLAALNQEAAQLAALEQRLVGAITVLDEMIGEISKTG